MRGPVGWSTDGERSAGADALIRDGLLALGDVVQRYFRYEVHGLERVPARGPAVIVAPHSNLSLDSCLLAWAIQRRYGRLPKTIGDHVLFTTPLVRRMVEAVGGVDGTPENALGALTSGELLFVMPGGAKEAWRSSARRYLVDWDGHEGFVRVALRAGAPIIPTACIGADDALWLPINALDWGQRVLGRRLPLMPGLGIGPLPLPVKLTAYVSEPLPMRDGPAAADDPAVVARIHAEVVRRTEALIGEGLRRRRSLWR